jgi:hypothetical protein
MVEECREAQQARAAMGEVLKHQLREQFAAKPAPVTAP